MHSDVTEFAEENVVAERSIPVTTYATKRILILPTLTNLLVVVVVGDD